MKIKILKSKITLYMNNIYLKNKNLKLDKNFISKIIKTLKYYNINLNGYYSINIFIDKNYGIITEIIKKYNYQYLKQIDTKVKIKKNTFLFKIKDILDINSNEKIYKYKNNYYLQIDKNIIKYLEYFEEICYNTKSIIKLKNLIRG